MGFAFRGGICELHLYSNGIPEDENPVPLEEVVSELIKSVESRLSILNHSREKTGAQNFCKMPGVHGSIRAFVRC